MVGQWLPNLPSSFSSDLTNERAGRSLHLKNGCRCDGRGQRVALGGPLGPGREPLTPFPAPPLAAAIGGPLFRAQPPATGPTKG